MRAFIFAIITTGFLYADNTIDFTQTPSASTTNATDTKQLSQSPILTNTNRITWELGIGYINAGFSAKQSDFSGSIQSQSQRVHGVDVFTNLNWHLHKYIGLSFGLGLEFLPIKWKTPIYEGTIPLYGVYLQENSSDFLLTEYITIGAFSNVWKGKNSALRIFANVGIGLNFLFGGLYNGSYTGYYTSTLNYKLKIPISIPFTFGIRYIFAKSHGFEIVGKAHAINMNYDITYYSTSILNTSISRNMSFGIRYVYEFQ